MKNGRSKRTLERNNKTSRRVNYREAKEKAEEIIREKNEIIIRQQELLREFYFQNKKLKKGIIKSLYYAFGVNLFWFLFYAFSLILMVVIVKWNANIILKKCTTEKEKLKTG